MRFRNYVNRHNRRNRIYSDEDLLKMTLESIFDNEPAILAQNTDVGIPTYEELEQSPNTEWVDPFTNEEGLQDGGYWQSILKPDYRSPVFSTGIKTPDIQHGIAGDIKTSEINKENDWNDARLNGLDEFLDKDLINSMPENLRKQYDKNQSDNQILKGHVEKKYGLIDKVKDEVQTYIDNIKSKFNDTQKKDESFDKVDNDKNVINNDKKQKQNILEYLQGIFNDYKSLQDPETTALYVLGEFLTNYNNMKDADTHGADKYFHAKANYEAAQQGVVGSAVAKLISDIREWSDSDRNIKEKKYTPEESLKDIEADQRANEEGRDLGRKYPISPPYEILKHLMPNGLPKRYRRRW